MTRTMKYGIYTITTGRVTLTICSPLTDDAEAEEKGFIKIGETRTKAEALSYCHKHEIKIA